MNNTNQLIQKKFSLDFQWPTQEPFLFCVHHNDDYPAGSNHLGPEKKFLSGRSMGQDFQLKDGFRMYHGEVVPGFPVHPHRGFETITIVRRGFVDHSDSMGAAGRYGEGDVQWMTAGRGVQHSEMFALINKDQPNPLELFQIWLNLPQRSKMSEPHFTMFWNESIQHIKVNQDQVRLSLIAGKFLYHNQIYNAPKPPPSSWASDDLNEVTIWLVKMNKGSQFDLPTSSQLIPRTLYFFDGLSILINDEIIKSKTGLNLNSQISCKIQAVESDVEFLMLQAKSINEPVVQHGPFVMNSKEEILQTMYDYQKTQFGGWPWPRAEMTHGHQLEKFAKFPDGRIEKPKS